MFANCFVKRDLLGIVGHVPRGRYRHQRWGGNAISVPNSHFGGTRPLSLTYWCR